MTNPTAVEFVASPDHDAVSQTVPVVSRYDLEVCRATTGAVVKVQHLGKPTPDANGLIVYDQLDGVLTTVASADYVLKVAAVGPGGTGRSESSEAFTVTALIPIPRPPGLPVVLGADEDGMPDLFLGSKRDFRCVADGVTDDTANLQAFFSDISNPKKIKILEDGSHKYSTPLTLPDVGTSVIGVGSSGSFASVLRPTNCAAFNLSNTHESLLHNFMIWPQGTTPPTHFIRLENSYSIVFRDIRLHLDTSYQCTTAAVIQRNVGGQCNDIIYDHVTVRSDGAYFPVGFRFEPNCGSATLKVPDIETCGRGVQHLGGRITILAPYMERHNPHCFELWPKDDPQASLAVVGGIALGDDSSVPIAIKTGAKHTKFTGVMVDVTSHNAQGYVYDMGGVHHVVMDLLNYDAALWGNGTGAPLDATKLTFR